MLKKLKFTKEVILIGKAQVTSSKEQQVTKELWLARTRRGGSWRGQHHPLTARVQDTE